MPPKLKNLIKTVKTVVTMVTTTMTGHHDLRSSVEGGKDGARAIVGVHGVDGAGQCLS